MLRVKELCDDLQLACCSHRRGKTNVYMGGLEETFDSVFFITKKMIIEHIREYDVKTLLLIYESRLERRNIK